MTTLTDKTIIGLWKFSHNRACSRHLATDEMR